MVHGSIAPPWLQALGGTVESLSTPLGPTPMELNVFRADQRSAMQTLPEFTGQTFARDAENLELYAGAFTSGVKSREARPRGYQGYRMNSQERLRRSHSPRNYSGVQCLHCGRMGHYQWDCWFNQAAQQPQHGRGNFSYGQNQSQFSPQSRSSKEESRCYKCQQTGHFFNQCPEQGEGNRRSSPRRFANPGGS